MDQFLVRECKKDVSNACCWSLVRLYTPFCFGSGFEWNLLAREFWKPSSINSYQVDYQYAIVACAQRIGSCYTLFMLVCAAWVSYWFMSHGFRIVSCCMLFVLDQVVCFSCWFMSHAVYIGSCCMFMLQMFHCIFWFPSHIFHIGSCRMFLILVHGVFFFNGLFHVAYFSYWMMSHVFNTGSCPTFLVLAHVYWFMSHGLHMGMGMYGS